MSPPTITLLYFASLRTSLSTEPYSSLVPLPSSPSPFTLHDLRSYLVNEIHRGNDEFARALERSAWSVDEEMVDLEEERERILLGGEVVCGIPPVSGG
ncbi:hypothetical protein JCM1841_000840 [Sporobolomyces salmonicolor]